jgi:3-hydroxyisobutyrate dehydrogenase
MTFSRIGVIGLGNMGMPMLHQLLKKRTVGEVRCWDTDILKRIAGNSAADPGPCPVDSVDEVATYSDAIVTMLPTAAAVEDMCEQTLFPRAKKATMIIDCSTVDPATSRRLAGRASERGLAFVDAPVSGGVAGATAGTLTFMVGAGSAGDFDRASTLLSLMGSRVIHCGGPGSGSAVKLCNNLALAVQMVAVSEASALGVNLGVNPKVLADVMNASTAGCWAVAVNHPIPGVVANAPASRGYRGGFTSQLMLKDLRLAVDAAEKTGTATPLGRNALDLYARMVESSGNDYGAKDFSAVYEFLSTTTTSGSSGGEKG